MPPGPEDPVSTEGNIIDPPPDPWAPPRANATQAASIATGATGAALLIGDQVSGSQQGALSLIPDPTQVFASLAHLLGLQVSTSALWTLGLVLVVLSVALNVYSYFLRRRYAEYVKPRWDAQLAAIQRNLAVQQQAATPGAKGFVAGDA